MLSVINNINMYDYHHHPPCVGPERQKEVVDAVDKKSNTHRNISTRTFDELVQNAALETRIKKNLKLAKLLMRYIGSFAKEDDKMREMWNWSIKPTSLQRWTPVMLHTLLQ